MQHLLSPTADAAFNHWLAGLIDGEGSFEIKRHQKAGATPYYATNFQLGLRDDDAAVLREVQTQTGLGKVYMGGSRGTSNPRAVWKVERKADCAALVAILDKHPLRSKKARDFALWREAVAIWVAMHPIRKHGPRGPQERLRSTMLRRDWTQMVELRDKLSATRIYIAP